jgi:hypothetical protein
MMVRLVVRCLAGAALLLSAQFAVAEPGPARQNPGDDPIRQDRVTEVEDLLKRDRECRFHDPDRGGSHEDCDDHHGGGGRHRDGCGCKVSPH